MPTDPKELRRLVERERLIRQYGKPWLETEADLLALIDAQREALLHVLHRNHSESSGCSGCAAARVIVGEGE
jgi:hypothetical protein